MVASFNQKQEQVEKQRISLYDAYGAISAEKYSVTVNNLTRMSPWIYDIATSANFHTPVTFTEVFNTSKDKIAYISSDNIPLVAKEYPMYSQFKIDEIFKHYVPDKITACNEYLLDSDIATRGLLKIFEENPDDLDPKTRSYSDGGRSYIIDPNAIRLPKNKVIVRVTHILPEYTVDQLLNRADIDKVLEHVPTEALREFMVALHRKKNAPFRKATNFHPGQSITYPYFISTEYEIPVEKLYPSQGYEAYYFKEADLLLSVHTDKHFIHPFDTRIAVKERYDNILKPFAGHTFVVEFIDNTGTCDPRYLRFGYDQETNKSVVYKIVPTFDPARETGFYFFYGQKSQNPFFKEKPIFLKVEEADSRYGIYKTQEAAETIELQKEIYDLNLATMKYKTATVDSEAKATEAQNRLSEANNKIELLTRTIEKDRETHQHEMEEIRRKEKAAERTDLSLLIKHFEERKTSEMKTDHETKQVILKTTVTVLTSAFAIFLIALQFSQKASSKK